MKTKNSYDEKDFDSAKYLKNVLISWDEFCKQHSKFEGALKDVLEENERLKAKRQAEPKKLQLELIRRKTVDGRTTEIYKIGKYIVRTKCVDEKRVHLEVIVDCKTNTYYTPHIFVNDNLEGIIYGFTIETTAYGSLSSEEITKVIDGLREAQEVVEVLTEQFKNK